MASPNGKQRLELTWIGKENRPSLEPRILLEDAANSHHAARRVSENDLFDNRLIFGDNLLALKALEQEFTGKVKCIYIDPPYNTGQAMLNYDDGVEHSIWLGLMKERLEILRRLLTKDGTIFVQLNDDEMAYGKVLMDEVFGRQNFLNQVSVKMKQTAGASGGGEDKRLKKNIEYILIAAKDKDGEGGFQKFNDLYDEENLFEVIEGMDAQGKSWKYTSILVDKGHYVEQRIVFDGAGDEIRVTKYKGVTRTTVNRLVRDGLSEEAAYTTHFDNIFSDTNAQTSIRARIIDEFRSLDDDELLEAEYVPRSGRDKNRLVKHYYISPTIRRVIWLKDTAVKRDGRLIKLEKTGTYWQGFPLNNLTKEGGVQFPQGKKPEALVRKVFQLATEPGDLVLDSFSGSGTTGAAAHKMGLRWIMIELGDHTHSHIIPRMKKVIDGHDPGGVTEATGWKGGGGFRYFRLAPSLLELDRFGNHVISREYNAAMLAEAMCKLMGFTYQPDQELYWQQGRSTETDFLYTTTQTLSRQQIESLSEEVGPHRSLIVCCSAFRAKAVDFPNLTLRKIPMAVLARCEWGKDDYSLNVANLPQTPAPPEAQDPLPESAHADRPPASPADARKRRAGAKQATNAGAGSLFDTVVGQPEVSG